MKDPSFRAPYAPDDTVIAARLLKAAALNAEQNAQIDRTATCKDPQLQTALELVADGRMPRAALRQVLEEALWRWGSHPGLAPWQHERLLVRDLLLSGSNAGGGKYQAHVQPDRRYYPTGLDRNDGFFVVAVALYEFMIRPRAPLPPEHRLPQ